MIVVSLEDKPAKQHGHNKHSEEVHGLTSQ